MLVYVGTCQACPMNAVLQEEFHARDHRSWSKCAEQSNDRTGLIADDDDQCKLRPAYSTSVSNVEPCRGGT